MFKYLTRFANIIALFVVLQALVFASLVFGIARIYPPAGIALIVFSVLCALFVASGESHSAYKLAWVTVIMLLPLFGGMFYVFYSRKRYDKELCRSLAECIARALSYQNKDEIGLTLSAPCSHIALYLENTVGFSPALSNNAVYFAVGEEKIAHMLDEISKAERYIFLEYFIIADGILWESFYEILKKKAGEGVDVRIICDGVGCLYALPWKFTREMAQVGIKVRMFNPVRPFISARINSRSHRKMAVIDGKTAFCGGINLADEYANLKEKYGHWKDSGVKVDGGTAWNMTLLFLSMWEYLGKERGTVDYKVFQPQANVPDVSHNNDYESGLSLSVPVLDVPKDGIHVSEHTFISFILRAEKSVYITTPYLICGGEILSALYTAARSGVDVRVITPYIADKKIVKLATESYYRALIENGVRIFEYLPGFIHAKNIIADGKRAMVGTVNLDYRSLYLHHECGVCFFGGQIIKDIDDDFRVTFGQCKEVTLSDLGKVSLFKRVGGRACRLLAPFL
ncbi:MAG: phospholipase D-like domain-containing protein [Oscillospiraceae bacterium]|nr:phospholipase D-like domain-containing protein [Oscillospiraceae bacterium]